MFVRDVMLQLFHCISPRLTLPEVATELLCARQEHVLVAEAGVIHGFVSERELVFGAEAQAQGEPVRNAGDIASARFVITRVDEPVDALVRRMIRAQARRAVAVDAAGRPVGVLSPWELVRAVGRQRRETATSRLSGQLAESHAANRWS